jgi:nicotinic acid mononucleotide adenylyltransferase
MLRLAIESDKRFEISDVELQRGGVSYTIDSVRHFPSAVSGRSSCTGSSAAISCRR